MTRARDPLLDELIEAIRSGKPDWINYAVELATKLGGSNGTFVHLATIEALKAERDAALARIAELDALGLKVLERMTSSALAGDVLEKLAVEHALRQLAADVLALLEQHPDAPRGVVASVRELLVARVRDLPPAEGEAKLTLRELLELPRDDEA